MDDCAADRCDNHHNCHNQAWKKHNSLREFIRHNVRRTIISVLRYDESDGSAKEQWIREQ